MHFLHILFLVLLSVTALLNVYIHLFPVWRDCTFPTKDAGLKPSSNLLARFSKLLGGSDVPSDLKADFRLLAFGDPQLEGDTSVWKPGADDLYVPKNLVRELNDAESPADKVKLVGKAVRDAIIVAVPNQLKAWRKQIDLWGNDFYLAHIYRSIDAFSDPTHTTVLGDLLGSQWIGDEEFERRSRRFWERVYRNGHRVDDDLMTGSAQDALGWHSDWRYRVINIAGNHDIGYAGDITPERVERFERAFGKVNWHVNFLLPEKANENSTSFPSLRIVVLNSMNLDTPAKHTEIQDETYGFIKQVIDSLKPVEDRSTGTILLTHIPLHKEHGICVDGPHFAFNYDDQSAIGLREQNHLSDYASKGILEGIFGYSGNPNAPAGGMGRNGIILTGHDHEGCDVYHHLPLVTPSESEEGKADGEPTRQWTAVRWQDAAPFVAQPIPGIREVTLRSMMGEFGGYAYLLSAWVERATGEWRFEVNRCGAGVQHWWWAAHIMLLVTAAEGALAALWPLERGGKPVKKKLPKKSYGSPQKVGKSSPSPKKANGKKSKGKGKK